MAAPSWSTCGSILRRWVKASVALSSSTCNDAPGMWDSAILNCQPIQTPKGSMNVWAPNGLARCRPICSANHACCRECELSLAFRPQAGLRVELRLQAVLQTDRCG